MDCPDDDTLAAFSQRALPAPETEQVACHLDECATCRHAALAGARAVTPVTPVTPVTLARGTRASAPAHPSASVPAHVGRYRILRLLGAGGMGQVYEAHDDELDRAIAVKVLRPELATSLDLVERLRRESRLTAKIAHPAVMTIYDVGRAGELVYIAMELIRGETLGAHVARTRPDWRAAVALYQRAAAGLAAAHAAGVIHRDFKPENVLVELVAGAPARVVVTDFGIARETALPDAAAAPGAADPIALTAPGAAPGTPAYMAPEQLAGLPVDARADVFSFAASLWEAIFGRRPFAGLSVAELRAALAHAPQPTRAVPRGLLRALRRGLARAPDARWPDLPAFARALASVQARRRRVVIGAASAGVVGVIGVALAAGSLAAPGQAAPCERAEAAYDRAALVTALAHDPTRAPAVLAALDQVVGHWTATNAATCHPDAEPAQPPMVAACLDARRVELAGVAADLTLDGASHADDLVREASDPAACAQPASGALFSRVPADAAVRRVVTGLRYRAYDAEAARDRADFPAAIAQATALVHDAETAWPPVLAEALYVLGTAQIQGGANPAGAASLRRAAAVAEAAHHDFLAAAAWTQLVFSANGDDGDPVRALEYATYADAALDRAGRPVEAVALFEYARGAALVDADRTAEAERVLRHAVELAETRAPSLLPQAIQGLAYLYEKQGRYADAVSTYRRALVALATQTADTASSAVVFRDQLALNLTQMGDSTAAVAMAREAVALADTTLGSDNLDRALAHGNLAQALHGAGQEAPALAEAQTSVATLARIAGDRSERYGEALRLEGDILGELGRPAEGAAHLARACDVIAFQTGSASTGEAECLVEEAVVLSTLDKPRAALALVDQALPVLVTALGATHPEVANALVARGSLHATLHEQTAAVTDLERGIALFEGRAGDPGQLGAAQLALAEVLWRTEPVRARALLAAALAKLGTGDGAWAHAHAEAAEWLASDGHPRPPR